jgi:hypothetical protein
MPMISQGINGINIDNGSAVCIALGQESTMLLSIWYDMI